MSSTDPKKKEWTFLLPEWAGMGGIVAVAVLADLVRGLRRSKAPRTKEKK